MGVVDGLIGFLALAQVNSADLPIPQEFQDKDVVTTVAFVHPWKIEPICFGRQIEDYITYGCYDFDRDLMVLPNPCLYPEAKQKGSFANLVCHERAHVAGWTHKD